MGVYGLFAHIIQTVRTPFPGSAQTPVANSTIWRLVIFALLIRIRLAIQYVIVV